MPRDNATLSPSERSRGVPMAELLARHMNGTPHGMNDAHAHALRAVEAARERAVENAVRVADDEIRDAWRRARLSNVALDEIATWPTVDRVTLARELRRIAPLAMPLSRARALVPRTSAGPTPDVGHNRRVNPAVRHNIAATSDAMAAQAARDLTPDETLTPPPDASLDGMTTITFNDGSVVELPTAHAAAERRRDDAYRAAVREVHLQRAQRRMLAELPHVLNEIMRAPELQRDLRRVLDDFASSVRTRVPALATEPRAAAAPPVWMVTDRFDATEQMLYVTTRVDYRDQRLERVTAIPATRLRMFVATTPDAMPNPVRALVRRSLRDLATQHMSDWPSVCETLTILRDAFPYEPSNEADEWFVLIDDLAARARALVPATLAVDLASADVLTIPLEASEAGDERIADTVHRFIEHADGSLPHFAPELPDGRAGYRLHNEPLNERGDRRTWFTREAPLSAGEQIETLYDERRRLAREQRERDRASAVEAPTRHQAGDVHYIDTATRCGATRSRNAWRALRTRTQTEILNDLNARLRADGRVPPAIVIAGVGTVDIGTRRNARSHRREVFVSMDRR